MVALPILVFVHLSKLADNCILYSIPVIMVIVFLYVLCTVTSVAYKMNQLCSSVCIVTCEVVLFTIWILWQLKLCPCTTPILYTVFFSSTLIMLINQVIGRVVCLCLNGCRGIQLQKGHPQVDGLKYMEYYCIYYAFGMLLIFTPILLGVVYSYGYIYDQTYPDMELRVSPSPSTLRSSLTRLNEACVIQDLKHFGVVVHQVLTPLNGIFYSLSVILFVYSMYHETTRMGIVIPADMSYSDRVARYLLMGSNLGNLVFLKKVSTV